MNRPEHPDPRPIRPVTESDLDAITKIGQAALGPWWGSRGFLEETLRDPARTLLLAADSAGQPAAFIDYRRELDEIHLFNLATHPANRRSGYASRLLEHVVRRAPAKGVRQVSLEVRRSNLEAIRLYSRFGFENIGVRPLYYGDTRSSRLRRRPENHEENREDAIFMRLILPTPNPFPG